MEMLSVNKGSGQSYGFTLYRTMVDNNARKVTISKLKDHGVAMLDFVPFAKLTWFAEQTFLLPENKDVSRVYNTKYLQYGLLLEIRSTSVGHTC